VIIPDGSLWIEGEETLGEHLVRRGVSRRDFLKFCATVASVLSAGPALAGTAQASVTGADVARALEGVRKPVVVWLQLQECTGCMESVLRSGDTTVEELILNLVSLDYNELLMAAAGTAADEALIEANKNDHILVVNGSVPRGEGGAYTTIAGRSAESILRDSAANATAIFAVGACAHWGCVQASRPNPTDAVGVDQIITDKQVVNIAGCPPIPEVITASLVYTLMNGSVPPVDGQGRPLFAYGERIHDFCPKRAKFDAGQFVRTFDDDAARDGYCLYEVGCRGPNTFAPCPILRWNLAQDWPIGAGHPCIGCTEVGFYDRFTPFYQVLPNLKVPGVSVEANATTVGLAGLALVGVGVAAHAGLTAMWERRANRAASTVYLPLLGDLPTRERPLESAAGGSPPPPPRPAPGAGPPAAGGPGDQPPPAGPEGGR
jgi:hydrogenase small subunit